MTSCIFESKCLTLCIVLKFGHLLLKSLVAIDNKGKYDIDYKI